MNNAQESHPDLNKDPKASEDFQRVKMAYDRLRSSQDEEERRRTSEKDYFTIKMGTCNQKNIVWGGRGVGVPKFVCHK